ncbi:MAG: vitamin B12-dependent ribonucleotide reductase, partial [Acidobacteriota bacterium]|nr:vitamin B12-dependent ribonucleotide reductase [Acidobacteriota bacterium]
ALLMSRGLPYDGDSGRDYAAAITALMHGAAFAQSAKIARDHGGPFAGYEKNKEPFIRVMRKHRAALKDIDRTHLPSDLFQAARAVWDEAIELGEQHGFRNAQATVLAPTGTIGFMMDCDTTGVEPDIALVKYKKLVGGGLMKIVNQTVPMALTKLGYNATQIKEIIEYIDENETIEGAPHVKEHHLAVFDCAFKPARGVRSIHYMGHIKMMGATQPFLSGAISKTVNVPKEASVEEIQQAYIDSWRIGAKAVSIYRDGSKRTQPLNTARDKEKVAEVPAATPLKARRKLPDERHALTHKFDIAGHEGYITVGLFEDGTPGEIFLVMAKEGSTISGFADAFAQAISYALQYGVPLQDLVDKFSHVRFEPSGMTKNPDVRFAKSIVDYIFRWMAAKFLSADAQFRAGVNNREELTTTPEQLPLDVAAAAGASPTGALSSRTMSSFAAIQNQEDAPPCSTCGSIMVRSGSCYKCANCGTTSGCA